MVKYGEIRSTIDAYFQNRPLVAVFFGGVKGLGSFSVQALAKQYANQSSPLRVYIVGRDKNKSDQLISSCSRTCSKGTFQFVQADDLTSIVSVDKVCNDILRREREGHATDNPRIDLLMLTQGQVLLGPRQETSEGLDRSMSLLYYSRVRAITTLLPLLNASSQAHIVSVYAAGAEATLHKDDLSLRDPAHYSFANCRSHCVHMKTMAFEHLAKENPKVSFVHIYPGLVVHEGFWNPSLPFWLRATIFVFRPITWLTFETGTEEAGYRMLYAGTDRFPAWKGQRPEVREPPKGTDGAAWSGAYALGRHDDVVKYHSGYDELRNDGFREKVWKHTMDAFETIVGGNKFVS